MAPAKTRSRSSKRSTSSKRSASSKRGSSSKRSTSSKRSNGSRNSRSDADRYRRAAEDALQQLDWTIGYLHGIKKTEISKALAQNRSYIRSNLMGEAEEPLPTQKTDET